MEYPFQPEVPRVLFLRLQQRGERPGLDIEQVGHRHARFQLGKRDDRQCFWHQDSSRTRIPHPPREIAENRKWGSRCEQKFLVYPFMRYRLTKEGPRAGWGSSPRHGAYFSSTV